MTVQKNKGKGQESAYTLACMTCKSHNLKVVSADEALTVAPKYECLDCGRVGMPIEIKTAGRARGV